MRAQETSTFSTAAVAARIGVHRDTLLRWLRDGKIPEPARDRHGWRVFSENEVRTLERFAQSGTGMVAEESSVYLDPLQNLRAMDWDFVDAKTNYLTHGLHPYPAKFIPQIPNALIQELSSVGETVADIFCGSGTTLVEALTLKRNAVGVDANPLACLISAAKTALLQPQDVDLLRAIVARAERSAEIAESGQGNLFQKVSIPKVNEPASDKRIQFWFEPFIIDELHMIKQWCEQCPSDEAKTVALASFSAIIVAVSRQDSDTRYVRRSKQLCPGDAFKRFSKTLDQAVRSVTEFTEIVEPRFNKRIYHADILSGPDIGPVDLVVCSPPYPNAYSYHLYHMTRMIWLGMDQPAFKSAEIGSHRKYSKKKKGATIDTFRGEMIRILSWLAKHLKNGRFACFVVGDSIINRQRYSNADLLVEVAQKSGYRTVGIIQRQMQDTKKAFNPAIGKIKQEQIVILQKVNGVTR